MQHFPTPAHGHHATAHHLLITIFTSWLQQFHVDI
jgi:hypothetical protein